MKREFATLIMLLLVLVSTKVSADENQKIYTIGFAQDTMSNDWRAAQVNEMKNSLESYPFIRFVHTDAKGKVLRQVIDLQTLDKQGADILVTSPRDQKAMTPVITALNKRKPVVLLTRKTLNDTFTSFAGPDDLKIARQAARLVAEKLEGKGKVVMLMGVATATTAMARRDGFLQELENYPEIEIVASPVADYRRHKAVLEMGKLLQKGVEFDAIYAHSDSMASGARLAMENAGLNAADVIIVGIDYTPEAKKAIQEGKQTASFTYPTAGRQGAEIVLRLVRGEKVDKFIEVPSILVTADNVDETPTIFD